MGKLVALTGNYSVAYAAKYARIDVVAAYPITPQTSIVEKLAELIESGELDATMIRVESEHSALAATFGAAVAGARAFTATSSQGLMYMHEWVHWTARARIPVVMAIVTRALAPPWNIWPDHTDFMDQRDTGWIMSFGMDNQEVFDLTLQAFKISEDPRVYLPVMVGLEGFILGHTTMPVELPDQKDVDDWLGPRKQGYVVDGKEPIAIGNLAWPEDTEEMLMDIQKAMNEAKNVIKEVDQEYGKIFGRSYGGLIQCINCEDAKYYAVSMGAWSGDLIEAVNMLREEGYPIGVLRIRYYRPFPYEDIWEKIRGAKGVIVFDRAISFGAWGQIFTDLITGLTMYTRNLPVISNIVAGIGGVNVTYTEFYNLVKEFIEKIEKGEEPPLFKWYHRR
ncbi:pyruvate ferredoxin oxidoreductase [Staphylothermus hellenicus]|uniref:2-oxoacid oxidoreductase (ferredoxin) n=1 Tax=Staphylothermus hellenicus (strain DSM 12710 / JCM 10830 / BK20S6-10-b1 / P8) TaxID=591019 RepID=D7D9V5_STAHD|nr:pyruvate ferredoxin oxidoreductase [Staphylothermus hellenicus]ADI32551.1 pyruvate flavodoxin/ferredoxin oxidoreductase domain protein [Staphylothermus hellenicus DSM 12710]